jgi:hypothetical protein
MLNSCILGFTRAGITNARSRASTSGVWVFLTLAAALPFLTGCSQHRPASRSSSFCFKTIFVPVTVPRSPPIKPSLRMIR